MTQGEIIYVNGDSFTAGSDLGDYLLPGFPSTLSLDEFVNNDTSESIIKYIDWRFNAYDRYPDLMSNVLKLERELRWSSILSKLVDVDVINKACPGADNYSIFIRTCNDIERLRSEGYKIAAVIIQLTGFGRCSYVRHISNSNTNHFRIDVNQIQRVELEDGFFLRHVMPIQRGSDRLTEKENEFLNKVYYEDVIYEDQDESSRFLSYLLTLKLYKDAVKGVAGIEPIIVDSLFMKRFLHNADLYKILSTDSYISKLFNYIFSDQMLSMYDIPSPNEKSLTGGAHFMPYVHMKFAEQIVERYFNE